MTTSKICYAQIGKDQLLVIAPIISNEMGIEVFQNGRNMI